MFNSSVRLLVCGGRDYADRDKVFDVLDFCDKGLTFAGVMHGGANGADALAREWAIARGKPHMSFKADWSRGPRAGPERNARMLAEGRPDLVIAFPGGRGTADMIVRARKAGLPVWEVDAEQC